MDQLRARRAMNSSGTQARGRSWGHGPAPMSPKRQARPLGQRPNRAGWSSRQPGLDGACGWRGSGRGRRRLRDSRGRSRRRRWAGVLDSLSDRNPPGWCDGSLRVRAGRCRCLSLPLQLVDDDGYLRVRAGRCLTLDDVSAGSRLRMDPQSIARLGRPPWGPSRVNTGTSAVALVAGSAGV